MQEIHEMQVWSLVWEDPLEEDMATHSSVLAWRIHGQRRLETTVSGVTKSGTRLRMHPEKKGQGRTLPTSLCPSLTPSHSLSSRLSLVPILSDPSSYPECLLGSSIQFPEKACCFFFFFDDHFKSLYWMCYNISSVLCFLLFWHWGMWGLSSLPRDGTCILLPLTGRGSLKHWIAREVPGLLFWL